MKTYIDIWWYTFSIVFYLWDPHESLMRKAVYVRGCSSRALLHLHAMGMLVSTAGASFGSSSHVLVPCSHRQMLPMMGGNRRRDQNIVLLFLSDALDARAACAHAVPNKIFLNCERVYSLVVIKASVAP